MEEKLPKMLFKLDDAPTSADEINDMFQYGSCPKCKCEIVFTTLFNGKFLYTEETGRCLNCQATLFKDIHNLH